VLEQARQGRFALVTSVLVRNEIATAPENVRLLFRDAATQAELVDMSAEAVDLRDAYVKAGILSRRRAADALHVAIATVSACSVIVSWNFRHIVHFQKVPLYNAVNRLRGYHEIAICSPPEVIQYGKEEEA